MHIIWHTFTTLSINFSLLWDIETIEFPFVGIDDAYSASNKAYRMMSMHGWSGVALVLFAILSLKSKIILHSRTQLPYDHILQYQLWPSTEHFCVVLNQLRCVDAHEQKLFNGCCDCIHKYQISSIVVFFLHFFYWHYYHNYQRKWLQFEITIY